MITRWIALKQLGVTVLFATALVVAVSAPFQASAEEGLTPVTLQLKWRHQFQFAGYYAAKAKGFYEQVGLDVSIEEAQPGIDPIEQVLNGHADFGVGTSELILERSKGNPVVVLGVIFQHSPLNLITLENSGIDNVHELVGKRVMVEHNSAELLAYFKCEGFGKGEIEIVDHSFDTRDLLSGKVDAMSIYVTDEPYELERTGDDYNLFSPRACAIDFYGDNFFTLESTVLRSPNTVEAFRKATIQGWAYAMANIDETVDLILNHYSQSHSMPHLHYEARTMYELMRPDLIEPGYMTPGRWQHIAATYSELGFIDEAFDVKKMLYRNPGSTRNENYRRVVLFGGAGLLASLLILFTIANFYRQAKSNSHRLNTMFEYAPFGMIVLDNNFTIQSWNKYANKTFFWNSDEVLGKNLLDLIVPGNEKQQMQEKLRRVLEQNGPVHSENSNLRKDGEEIICEWINAPFKDSRNQNRFIVCIARDITARRRLEHELNTAANYDSLTGIANRRLIISLLKNAMTTATRMNKKVAVLFLDLDDFKEINDRYGHQAGDEILAVVAKRLQGAVRESDYVGRLAGDEFLVVLQHVDTLDDAAQVVNKINALIAEPCHIDDSLIHISVSVGVSLFPDDAEDLDQLIICADKLMYQCKDAHKQGKPKA